MAVTRVILGRRSAVVSVLLWGLVITGFVIFLTALIIALVYVGQKDPIHAHFIYWWLLSFHYVAWGATLPMLFGTVTLQKLGGFLNQAIILAILYILALIFDILAGIFYGILGFEACQGKNQDQVEAGICDNQQWVVWVLWILVITLIIHAAVGIVAALLDRFMRRSPGGNEADTSTGLAAALEDEEDPEVEARFNTNANYNYSGQSLPYSTVVYSAPSLHSTKHPALLASSRPPPPPRHTYAYVSKAD